MGGEVKTTRPDLAREGVAVESLHQQPTLGHVDGDPVFVVQTALGPRALAGRCTHYGGPLGEGLCVDGEVHCPWHHAAFDLDTGEAVGAPALDPVAVYETEMRDGRLYVIGRGAGPPDRPAPATPPGSVVIVGSGAAGSAAAETLRRHGYDGPIELLGAEPPVDRPNVSKDYLAGTAPEEWMPLRSARFYDDAGIHLINGVTVTAIDPDERRVSIEDGRLFDYDALLLAPGAEPRRLDVPGAELGHVHYLRTLADSKAVIAALGETENAVVVGAGFIGLEVAASLRHRDVGVTVVAPDEIPLSRILGEALGRFVMDLHRDHGVGFRLGSGVERIDERGVVLDGGEVLPADLVVVGIGVTPRTSLAEAAGLKVDDGIVVTDRLLTSDPSIWAAGDVARYPGLDGRPTRVEHWVLAERQGQTAARNMLGHDLAFTTPPFFWSQHYDVPINVTGQLDDWDDATVSGDAHERDVLVAFRKEGAIRAIATIYRDKDSLRAEHALANGDQSTLESLADAARP